MAGPKRFVVVFVTLIILYHLSRLYPTLTKLQYETKTLDTRSEHAIVIHHAGDNSTLCAEWHVDTDSWWQQHPDWTVTMENDTHYCFSKMKEEKKADFFTQIHNIQFSGNCSNMTVKEIWSSGWGADFLNVYDGILYALETKQPVEFYTFSQWHYAATKKKGENPVCPEKDLTCFFLNISSCGVPSTIPKEKVINALLAKDCPPVSHRLTRWAYEYATRPQTWLRRSVYQYSESNVKLSTPCTVMHVRRSDVVLHKAWSRKYHTIQEYVDAAFKENHELNGRTIFLLTDDQNAVEEATTQFPNYNWTFLDRSRHRGAEGGWENQIPSNDPKIEVIVILSTFRLVRQCDTLIHSHSGFSDYLYNAMDKPLRINLDQGKNDVYSANNSDTVNISSRIAPGNKFVHPVDNATFCVAWDVDSDSWWEHHPEWTASLENDTHYCFSPITDKKRASLLRDLHNIQFMGDCSNMTVKEIWSSGWRADFLNINDGLLYALETKQPVQFYTFLQWHYAASKKGDHPVCPSKDLTCFFLNISSCRVPSNIPEEKVLNALLANQNPDIANPIASWAYEYATRPQKWLRRAVYNYSKRVEMSAPCTVIHVRRSDVILHGDQSRKYHAVREYVNAAQEKNHSLKGRSVFLLTDDQNAIDEAMTQFPDLRWTYLDRQRHRGAEGGWENQIPSNDPRLEVIVILSTFRLIQQCDTLIHSLSGFSDYLHYAMDNPLRINIDEGRQDIFSANHSSTLNVSQRVIVKP